MKTKILLASLFTALLTSATAQAFLVPSNPPPVVQLAWSPSPLAATYAVYYGVGSLQYTNKIPVGNTTNAIVTLPARGVTYFFAVTASSSGGLESQFSNEVNFTPATPPAAPQMKPIVILAIQASPKSDGLFADTGMNWSVSPDQPGQFFRLKLNRGLAFAAQTPPTPWVK